jgi:hypothetical protein
MGWRGFSMPSTHRKTPSTPPICPAELGRLELCWANFGHRNCGHAHFYTPIWHFNTHHPKTIIAVPSRSMTTAGLTDHWFSGAARTLASVGSKARVAEGKASG